MYQVKWHDTLKTVPEAHWNRLVSDSNPFLEYAFLNALEQSGCVGANTGWQPRYLTLWQDRTLSGAAAAYLKWDSFGEYIFDHAWADAYMRAGLEYYPKLLVAVPFTPVNGERLLVAPDVPDGDTIKLRLAEAFQSYAKDNDLSSVHILFCTLEEQSLLHDRADYARRLSTQYHWINRDYGSFDDYLADLRSARRKQIKKERRQVHAHSLTIDRLTGDDIKPEHMEAMWSFYMDTGNRKWGSPYLNRVWFDLIHAQFRDRMLLVMARDSTGRYVAGTLNFYKGAHLYGRYWGCREYYPGLHFELCFYQLIEFAIERKMLLFEAGAQGEHKFLRGFATRPCHSVHWFRHPEGQRAIRDFLKQEEAHVATAIERMNSVSPLKHLRTS
ncbi:MAG: N-acetyltransferase [Leptospiraceae bacterium]|nr:N-acetyltransferase [Leptospiraceae bacterium]